MNQGLVLALAWLELGVFVATLLWLVLHRT